MKLERLEIQQLPGIQPGFVLDRMEPGVNLVLGPNASGKSSLVRALRFLVAGPGPRDPSALFLQAHFTASGRRWGVRRTGSAVIWEVEGRPSDPPSLPDPRFFHCYWLSVEDLMGEHEGDRAIVHRLRRELSGGYDLQALLARDGPFHRPARHGRKEADALVRQRRRVREIQGAYESLQRERESLPGLDRRIQEGAGIPGRLEGVDRALELLEVRGERIRREEGLKEFPAGPREMERLRGDELESLEKLDGRRRALVEDRRTWDDDRRAAEARLAASGLADGAPAPEELEGHRANLQKARELLQARSAAEKEADRAEAAVRTAAEGLGGRSDGSPPGLEPDHLSRAESLAREIQSVRARAAELEARLEGGPEPVAPEVLERHREGVAALRDWLGLGFSLGSAAIGSGVAAGAAAVALLSGLLDWRPGALGGAAAAVAAGLLLAVLVARARAGRSVDRARFARTGLDEPHEWSPTGVRLRLAELEEELTELRQRELRAGQAARDREALRRTREAIEDLEARKAELAAELGFDPEVSATGFDRLLRLAKGLDDARRAHQEALRTIRRHEEAIRGRTEPVRAFLQTWGVAPERPPNGVAVEVDSLATAMDRIAGRCQAAEEAGRAMEEADGKLERIDRELRQVEEDRTDLFRKAGLDPEEVEALRSRVNALAEFRTRFEQVREARIRERELQGRLEGEAELVELVEEGDQAALRAWRDELTEEAEAIEGLKEQRTALRTRIEEAGRDRRLEAAQGEVEEARAALEAARREAFRVAAGRFLLREVEEIHRSEHEPDVLRDARERFERYTHQEWTLVLDEGRDLAAFDRRLEEHRPLSALSVGTRIQLLLAVRMAWIRVLEEGNEGLPFFLDEALTTTDPDRFRRVVESLESLAADEGRQIFYLCAQPSDRDLWRWATGSEPHVLDLAEIRFGRPFEVAQGAFSVPEVPRVPAPDGDEPGAYAARLGVPPVDPRAGAGAIHLFHILRDDLGTLHGLIRDWRVATLGQLEGLLESSAAAHAVPEEEDRSRLAARCRVVRLWVERWREGRGQRVDRGVLEESGAVSAAFIEQVSRRADEVGGDPEALLEALPGVPRFRAAKIAELREWLEDHGYLDPGPTLSPSERMDRVLREGAGLANPRAIQEVVRWLEAGWRAGSQEGGGEPSPADGEAGEPGSAAADERSTTAGGDSSPRA